MVIYHIDRVILDIDMGCGLMIWEITVSITRRGRRRGGERTTDHVSSSRRRRQPRTRWRRRVKGILWIL
jgi:hypothetical protein